MLDFVKRLIAEKNILREQVVFIDFSEYEGQTIDPDQLVEDYYKTAEKPDLPPFFVFDEIQEIANLRQFVLRLFNQQYKIFLSGSNSKLLASELSTHFRGRVFECKVYPLTHKEILSFLELPNKKAYATVELAEIKRTYKTIFTFGSFPEIVITKNEFTKKEMLRGYFDFLLYKDLLERYKLLNTIALKYLLKKLTLLFTKSISIHNIFNDLKSQNEKV
jgi:predicted AAA+ superfamily ATPase